MGVIKRECRYPSTRWEDISSLLAHCIFSATFSQNVRMQHRDLLSEGCWAALAYNDQSGLSF